MLASQFLVQHNEDRTVSLGTKVHAVLLLIELFVVVTLVAAFVAALAAALLCVFSMGSAEEEERVSPRSCLPPGNWAWD